MRAILLTTIVLLSAVAVTAAEPAAEKDESPVDLGPAEGETSTPPPPNADDKTKPQPADAADAPQDRGRISGTILPVERVKQVTLVERARGLSQPASYDRKTGAFLADGLPPGVWAVEIETPWGRVQGVDMRFRPAELDKMKPPRKADDAKADPPPLDDEDRAEITRHVTGPERFMTARPLIFIGDGRRATVLVNLLRDRPFHDRKGDEILWRLETWYYEDRWGHWERLGGNVVVRERVSGALLRTWTRQFEPSLGGLEIAAGSAAAVTVDYTVPELPDAGRGLVAEGQATAAPQTPALADPAKSQAEPRPVKDKTRPRVKGPQSPGESPNDR